MRTGRHGGQLFNRHFRQQTQRSENDRAFPGSERTNHRSGPTVGAVRTAGGRAVPRTVRAAASLDCSGPRARQLDRRAYRLQRRFRPAHGDRPLRGRRRRPWNRRTTGCGPRGFSSPQRDHGRDARVRGHQEWHTSDVGLDRLCARRRRWLPAGGAGIRVTGRADRLECTPGRRVVQQRCTGSCHSDPD